MAMGEVDKLNSYNIHELQDMYNELTTILEYNREHYLNLFCEKYVFSFFKTQLLN